MPNDLAPDTISRAEAELGAHLAAERAARLTTERFAGRPTAPAPVPEPDAMVDFAGKTALPKEAADSLDRLIDQRIRGRVAPVLQKMGAAINEKDNANALSYAMDMAMAQNPDMAADPSRFMAASSAVEYEARQRGVTLSPGDMIRQSVNKYRELFPTPGQPRRTAAPAPDYVEGSTPPAFATPPGGRVNQPQGVEEKPENPYEKWYPEEEVIDLAGKDPNAVLKEITDDYQNVKNGYLEDKGMRSFMPKVAGPLRKRARERRKAAIAAAAAAGR